ncbi:MAG TPA: hypothetical protein VN181_07535 [Thermoanaerobaculia bacterium]|nr:hypothetical protein [Thermoanaerobaculia bacterium]
MPPGAEEAVDKYVEFHRLDPRKIGSFPASFVIPERMSEIGVAKAIMYRSDKVDPETLRRPRSAVNYIHEHDAGVVTYVPAADAPRDARAVTVPSEFRNVAALTRLGQCLGFYYLDENGDKREASAARPLPDLYTVPSGKCLLVIQSRREVLAMSWGGGLGVFARGIDG